MKAEAKKVTGGCLCGRVRYKAEAFLQNGYACHCTICQKSTGQPAELTVLIRAGTLRFVKGKPKFYITSPGGQRGFCAACGSRLLWQARDPAEDWLTNLCVGGLDNPAEVRLAFHMYADTQLPWYRICEDLPKFTETDSAAMMEYLRLE